jgi:hypothetical protein
VALVRRFYGLTSADAPAAPAASPAWPSGLVTPPGRYSLAAYGGVWDMTAPGLYVFFNPPGQGGTLTPAGNFAVVCQGDTVALLSAAAWLTATGDYDGGLDLPTLNNLATYRPLGLLCGRAVDWAKALALLPAAGTHRLRTVRLLTAQPVNNYCDGHVALEYGDGAGWNLADVAYRRYWLGSLGDWMAGLAGPELPLAPPACFGPPYRMGQTTGFHTVAFNMLWPKDVFTARVWQIPGIDDAGLTWCYLPAGTEARQAWVESLGWRVLSKADWLARFYP